MRSSFFFAVLLIGAVSVTIASAQTPANDTCATAIPIGNGVIAGSNVGATSGGVDPIGGCGAMGTDVWYAYTASCSGVATATFCSGGGSATYDTVLAAWTGTCGALSPLACNDDTCGLQSQISFGVTAGIVYPISVGGFAGGVGSFNLSLSCSPPAANDFCSAAVVLSAGVPVLGSNLTASTGPDPVVTSCGFNNGPDVWYVFVPTCSGTYEVTTCQGTNTGMDTVLGVWDATAGCGSLVPVACNDDDPTGCSGGVYFGLESRTSWLANAGTAYMISVAGYAGNTGNFGVVVTSLSGMTLNFFVAPGSIGYQISGGPTGSTAFTGITLAQGTYPNGWFFGIDAGFAELVNEYNLGFPFFSTLGGICGGSTVGPFVGAPSGLTVFGVSVIVPFGGTGPVTHSNPATGTVP
jgi:hypothetical protein